MIEQSEATLNAEFKWEFEVRAQPTATIKITKDNREVKLSDKITLTQSETNEYHYTLCFTSVGPSDMGKYKIVASNKTGSASCEANLTVSGAPHVIRRPEPEVSVPEKKVARVEFEISGIPLPEVTW